MTSAATDASDRRGDEAAAGRMIGAGRVFPPAMAFAQGDARQASSSAGPWTLARTRGKRASQPAIPREVPAGSVIRKCPERIKSADQGLHDRGQLLARLGQAVEVVL